MVNYNFYERIKMKNAEKIAVIKIEDLDFTNFYGSKRQVKTKEGYHVVVRKWVNFGNGLIAPTDINSPVAVDIILKAIASFNTKTKLRKRINEYISCLDNKEDKENFRKGELQFDKRRLISKDSKFVLQWKIRENPNLPVSYENQQTSIGKIQFEYNIEGLTTYEFEINFD